jgi:hypothetical protein
MQCRDGPLGETAKQRAMDQIDMEVNNVEVVGAGVHLVHQQHIVRQTVARVRVKPQCTRNNGNKFGCGPGIATGEQSNIMTAPNQIFRQPGNDALCSAVKLWRHALYQRCNLGNFHKLPRAKCSGASALP